MTEDETPDVTGTARTHEEEWDDRYRQGDRIWSGRANDVLLREITGMSPGRVLDLGCGEGGDAIWLARQGWQVLAVDVSGVALERVAEHALAEGVADRIECQRHDLAESFPAGEFDLVVSFFMHSWRDMPRENILRRAVAAIAVGGTLLVVGHSSTPGGQHQHHPEVVLPGPEEVLESLQLPEGAWEVLVLAEHDQAKVIDGEQITGRDNAVKVRRLA